MTEQPYRGDVIGVVPIESVRALRRPPGRIPIIAEEHVKLAQACGDCGGFEGTLHVDEAYVRAITCTTCGRELEVVDTFEETGTVRNVGVIGHPDAAAGLDIPAEAEVIVIDGMSSFVCCSNDGTYFDIRGTCPRCHQLWGGR